MLGEEWENINREAVTNKAFRYDSNTKNEKETQIKNIAVTINLRNSRVRIILGEMKEGDRAGS